MQEILEAGIEFIVWLQQYRTPGLDRFFRIYTDFGGSYYLYMFPLLLWCVDFRMALRLLPVFALTLFVNMTLKEWLAQPRPFQMDPRVVSDGEIGYGLPSGHAQLVVVFWGVIASWVARPWFWAAALGVMLLMGFSRIYLGVHFPSDVVAGWVLGAAMLWGALRYGKQASARIEGLSTGTAVGFVVALGASVFVFDTLLVHDHGHINRGIAGMIGGGGAGAVIAARHLHFDGRGRGWQRALRYALGMPLTLVFLGVLRSWGAPEGLTGGLVVALDLALLGLWLTLVAPWLFQLIRLSPAAPGEGPELQQA